MAQRRRPTESKARAREIPEPVSDRGDARLNDFVTDVDRLGSGQESGQPVKNGRLIAPSDKIGRYDDVIVAAIVMRGDPHQALRMRIRQRSHEHRVDDAEHGGVQTDPQGKCEHDDDAEPGRAPVQTDAVTDVLEEAIPPDWDEEIKRPLAQLDSIGVFRRHSRWRERTQVKSRMSRCTKRA